MIQTCFDIDIYILVSCTCISFHPEDSTLYLVGTEEGYIYKCSTMYSSAPLAVYSYIKMPIYALEWNYFNTNIFISCGADWNVYVWDQMVQ